jgi:DNA repair photolyase
MVPAAVRAGEVGKGRAMNTSLYQPRGRAAVYAQLAVNIFHQCSHGCRYCYCPRILHKSTFNFYCREPVPRPGLLSDLTHACEEWAAVSDERPAVHLSFIGDPLPRGGDHKVTNQVIHTLHGFGFPVRILSKSGILEPDTLRELSDRDSYWITLTSVQRDSTDYWEPFAGQVGQRINALAAAQQAGLKTGVSLEPVLSLEEARGVLFALAGCKVDPVWIGPTNHLARGYDWLEVKQQLAETAMATGLPVRWKEDVCRAR